MNGLAPWMLGAAAVLLMGLEAVTLSGLAGLAAFALLLVGFFDMFVNGGDWSHSALSLSTQMVAVVAVFLIAAVPWVRWRRRRIAGADTSGDPESVVRSAPGGEVVEVEDGGRVGRARLDRAFLGARDWKVFADAPLSIGGRVRVMSVEGNKLRVAPAEANEALKGEE